MKVTKEFMEAVQEYLNTNPLPFRSPVSIGRKRVRFANDMKDVARYSWMYFENKHITGSAHVYVMADKVEVTPAVLRDIEQMFKNMQENGLNDGHKMIHRPSYTSAELAKHLSNFVLLKDIQFSNCGFSSAIALTPQTINPITLSFTDCIFHKNFVLIPPTESQITVSFIKCNFEAKLKICNPETKACEGKQKNELYKDRQKSKTDLVSLKFFDCTMESADSKTTPFLRVGFLHVKEFVLRNLRVPNNAEVNIGDCHFEKFELSNIRNLGKFKLYKINILKGEKGTNKNSGNANYKFQIDNTSLGDADFQSINLYSFNKLKIFDNILSDIDYTNINWGKHIKGGIAVGQYSGHIKLKLEKKRDTYRVLKNVALKNNDLPQALAFFAKEMEFHRKLATGFQDKFTLWFSYWTNNFGQSWWRPVWLIFGLGVAFYSALLISLNGGYIFASAAEWLVDVITVQKQWEEALLELWSLVKSNAATVGKFFVFLNPTHSTESIAKDWGFWAYTIDFTFRVIEASLIYQAIQAFRRYARKF